MTGMGQGRGRRIWSWGRRRLERVGTSRRRKELDMSMTSNEVSDLSYGLKKNSHGNPYLDRYDELTVMTTGDNAFYAT